MTDLRVNISTAAQQPPPPANDPARTAQAILDGNTRAGVRDVPGIKASLDALSARDPALAARVRPLVERALTPVQRGQLAAANDAGSKSITAPDNRPIIFQAGAPSVSDRFAATPGTPSRDFYNRLDRIWGDGNPVTNDVVRIEAGLADLYRSGQTLEQAEAARTTTPAAGPDLGRLGLDLTQIGLDIVGIFEPTPFADLSNGVISLGRGIYDGVSNGSWSDFGWGVGNAAISVAGVLPYAGDTAKLLRLGKYADTVARAVEAAVSNPAARAALEPGLRAISDAVKAIPAGALDSLPESAANSIRSMKTKLDEFFGAGAKKADDVAVAGGRLSGSTLILDANKGTSFSVGGSTGKIGDAPSVRNAPDGRSVAKDVDGNDVTLRAPKTFDTKVANADGTITYTKNGKSVTYDQNGFPVFNAKADLYLDPTHIKSKNDGDHFRAANEMLGDALRADPSLAKKLGLNDAQVAHLTKQPPASTAPADLTWHHHQDTGRIQLVDRAEHAHFSGGHTGGMKLWGGGRD